MVGRKWTRVLFSFLKCYRCGGDVCSDCRFIGVNGEIGVRRVVGGGFRGVRDLVGRLRGFHGYGGGGVVSDLFVLRYHGRRYVLFYVPVESVDLVESELRRDMVALNGVVGGFRVVSRGGGVVWYAVRPAGSGLLWGFLWFLSGLVCRAWAVRGVGFVVGGDGVLRYGLPRVVFLGYTVRVGGDGVLAGLLYRVFCRAYIGGGGVEEFFIPVVVSGGVPSVSGFIGMVRDLLVDWYGLRRRAVRVYFDVPDKLCVDSGGVVACVDEGVLGSYLRGVCAGDSSRCVGVDSPYAVFFRVLRSRYGLDGLVVPVPRLVVLRPSDVEALASMLYGLLRRVDRA